MTREKWKLIPGFDGYRISNWGNVQSCRFGTQQGLVFKYWRPITPSLNGRRTHVLIDLVDREGKRRSYSIHRLLYTLFVGPIPDRMVIDHADRNGLNNTLDNLRLCERHENCANRRGWSKGKYKCVRPTKSGKYESRTTKDGVAVHLGYFDTEIDAAKAYNQYAVETFGEFAVLNKIEEPN